MLDQDQQARLAAQESLIAPVPNENTLAMANIQRQYAEMKETLRQILESQAKQQGGAKLKELEVPTPIPAPVEEPAPIPGPAANPEDTAMGNGGDVQESIEPTADHLRQLTLGEHHDETARLHFPKYLGWHTCNAVLNYVVDKRAAGATTSCVEMCP